MRRSWAVFLRVVVVLVGAGALVFLLWEPHLEGRNVTATVAEIYFEDPFLAYVYVASVPFFMALWRIFVMLGQAERGRLLSQETVTGLQFVKYCALSIIGFVAIAEVIILSNASDDHAGGVFMGILVTLGALVVAIGAMRSARAVRDALAAPSAARVRGEVG